MEDVRHDAKLIMSDCPSGLLRAEPAYPFAVAALSFAALAGNAGPSDLGQNAAHHRVALGGAVAGGDTGAFVASRTDPDPGGQLAGRSECLGSRSDLGDHVLRGADTDAGHLAQPLDRVLMLCFGLSEGLLHFEHVPLDLLDLFQV